MGLLRERRGGEEMGGRGREGKGNDKYFDGSGMREKQYDSTFWERGRENECRRERELLMKMAVNEDKKSSW